MLGLAFFLLCALPGCGGLLGSQIDDYQILNGRFDSENDGELVVNAQASIRFVDVEEVGGGSEVYGLSFRLNDGGSLEATLHGNERLNSGIDVLITRNGSAYHVEIEGEDVSLLLPGATDLQTVKLDMELDNDLPRLVVWTTGRSSLAAANFRSDQEMPSLARGRGIYWGLNLQSAVLTRAKKLVL